MHSEMKALVALLIAVPLASNSQPNRALTVCEVISEARKLEGRIVSVRGFLQDAAGTAGDPDFDELVADGCTLADGSLPRIQVVSPDLHFLANPPPGYKPDMKSVKRVERRIEAVRARGKRVGRILATVQGVVLAGDEDSRPQASTKVPRHRQYRAYLVIQAMRDVKLLEK